MGYYADLLVGCDRMGPRQIAGDRRIAREFLQSRGVCRQRNPASLENLRTLQVGLSWPHGMCSPLDPDGEDTRLGEIPATRRQKRIHRVCAPASTAYENDVM